MGLLDLLRRIGGSRPVAPHSGQAYVGDDASIEPVARSPPLQSLQGLGDVVHAIERETGQACELKVRVGEEYYLIGDLKSRRGAYRVEMVDTYGEYGPGGSATGRMMKNPHNRLSGTYNSYRELKQAVGRRAREYNEGNRYHHKGPDLAEGGRAIGVPTGESWGGGVYSYITIGTVIFPLLHDGEKVSIQNIAEMKEQERRELSIRDGHGVNLI